MSIFLLFWDDKCEHSVLRYKGEMNFGLRCYWKYNCWSCLKFCPGPKQKSHDDPSRLPCSSGCCFWNVYKCEQILSSNDDFFQKKFWTEGQHDHLRFKIIFHILGDSPRSETFPKAGFSTDFLFYWGKVSQCAIRFFIWNHETTELAGLWEAFELVAALRTFLT